MTAVDLPGYQRLASTEVHGEIAVLRGASLAGASVVVYTHVADLPTEELRLQLEAHADVMRMVTHPAIARFVELIDLPTRAALVAEAPMGRALADLSMLSYSVVDLLQIVIDVAPALAELHVHGVGHGAISARTVSLRDGDAMLAAPWTLGSRRTPADDLGALSRLLDDLMLQAGHQVPGGLRAVLDAGYRSAAGDGYRSVVGFVHDLSRCRDEFRATNMCSAFPLAVHRFALTWRDPARAIGVEPQLTALAEAVTAAELKGRPCVLVIEGPAGAGRTTLLTAFEQWLVERRIMHARAKFSTGSSHVPLAGPRDLVASAVVRVQAAPHATRQRVIEALEQRIGGNVAMAVQLAPSLSMLLGEHPEPGEGSAVDLAARAEVTAKAVIGAFAVAGPFVTLFDDAEAADPASLAVFSVVAWLAEPLVVVVARRTDADSNGLSARLDLIAGTGVPVRRVPVPPLSGSAMHQVVSDGLGIVDGSASPLAHALWARSGGNPGLAIADLHTLLAESHLVVDPRRGEWSWSEVALAKAPSPGVAELTRLRVQRVLPAHRPVLHAAALAGQLANPTVLAFALDRSVDTVDAVLSRLHADQLLQWSPSGAVRFHDDGLRRASEESIDEPTRGALRMRIGRAALALASSHGTGGVRPHRNDGSMFTEAQRFEVLQLLEGHEQALDADETAHYIEWCESAARSAHRSGGYAAALDLQLRALTALGPLAWEHDGDRTFELHLRAAENALIVGRTTLVDQLLDTAWAHQPNAMQRVRALRLLGNRWWTRQDQSGGLAEMQLILRDLGEKLPAKPTIAQVAREYMAVRRALRGRTPESFLDAPPLTDERVRASLDTMLSAVHLAYTTEPLTHVMLVLRGIRLTARHGVGVSSSYFVAGYGLLLCGLGRDLGRGIGFGRTGMVLADRSGGPVRTMVCFAYNGFVRHWGEPLHLTIEPLLTEYRDGLAIGRGGYAHTGGTFAVLHALLSCRPLARVDEMVAELVGDLERLGEGAFTQRVKLVGQAVTDLREGLGDRGVLDGERFSAPAWSGSKARRGEFALIVHTLAAFVALVNDRVDDAARSVRAASPNRRMAPGEVIAGQHAFQLAVLRGLGADVDRRAARRAERLLRRAAVVNPHDYAHRVELIDAMASHATTDQFVSAAATARSHDALADLCIIATIAGRRSEGPEEQQRWAAMAQSALRAWGAQRTTVP